MKINDLSNLAPLNSPNKNVSQKIEKKGEKTDSINISNEAREIIEQERQEKIDQVKQKISEGYYDRKQVLENTAKAILKELKSE